MPPGIASILVQVQSFFTIAIAAFVLHERSSARQIAGAAIALCGLAVVSTPAGTNGITLAGFALTMASAVSWATGNVLLRRARASDGLSTISWLAAIAILPLLALSFAVEGPERIGNAGAHVTPGVIGAALYIGVASTVFGYWAWGELLRVYPAAMVAPFLLLVPLTGTVAAALLWHESFGPARLAGMALILAGLAVLVLRRRQPMSA